MEQFSLEKWLQDKSRKVVTKEGKNVKIIYTDSPVPQHPIVGFIDKSIYAWTIDGKLIYSKEEPDKNDLFFADDEEKLTEFETAIYYDVCTIVTDCEGTIYGDKELKTIVKGIAKVLLSLARKEALKSLPKWKDVSEKNGAGTKDYKIVGYYLVKGNYAIYLEDLEKLPKE